jgi:hypothetical protein
MSKDHELDRLKSEKQSLFQDKQALGLDGMTQKSVLTLPMMQAKKHGMRVFLPRKL